MVFIIIKTKNQKHNFGFNDLTNLLVVSLRLLVDLYELVIIMCLF